MHFIGIDIGTSTICGVALDFDKKRSESISKVNDATLSSGNSWEKIQDPERILSIVLQLLDEFLHRYDDIKGIGITGQMHGILYTDRSGNSVSPLITWQDGRGNLAYSDGLSYAGYLANVTGYKVSSGFGLVSHFYNQKNRLVPENSYRICTIMDYVVMKLSGIKVPKIDPSNAASLGFFNLEKLQFDTSAIEKVSINRDLLPEVIQSNEIVGFFKKNIPVCPAIGDNQAGFLGSISDLEKSILVNVGTSGQISVFSGNFIEVSKLDTRPFPGGGYILVGASLCGGNSFKLLKNLFEKTVATFCELQLEDNKFFKVANSINLSGNGNMDNLQVETIFEGTRENPGKRGSINNISMNNLTPQDLIIGFYNGVCNELYDFYNNLPSQIKDGKIKLVGSGNAVRMNRLLCQAFENRFGFRLFIPEHKEEAAFGACLCPVVGGRYLSGFRDAGTFVESVSFRNADGN